jgi:hypothetical protein
MDKKILAIMVTLVLVAASVVAFVVVAAGGGLRKAGGFTALFDDLEYTGDADHDQRLQMPAGWHSGDKKSVSDQIVDMTYYKTTVSQTTVYTTTLWFVYIGDKWSDPYQGEGTSFYVPTATQYSSWLHINHGLFSITVSSATNLSARYSIGDVITLETMLETNNLAMLAFGDWAVADVL